MSKASNTSHIVMKISISRMVMWHKKLGTFKNNHQNSHPMHGQYGQKSLSWLYGHMQSSMLFTFTTLCHFSMIVILGWNILLELSWTKMKKKNTSDCLVFALQNDPQDGDMIPKWCLSSRLDIHHGPSPLHATMSALH